MNPAQQFLFSAQVQVCTDEVVTVAAKHANRTTLDVAVSGVLSALGALVAVKVEQAVPGTFADSQARGLYAEEVCREITACFKTVADRHGIPCKLIDVVFGNGDGN